MSDERKLTAEQVAKDIIWRCYQHPAVVQAAGKPEFRGLDVEIAAALESYAAERVAEEREACAQLLSPKTRVYGPQYVAFLSNLAAAIRRRGQKCATQSTAMRLTRLVGGGVET